MQGVRTIIEEFAAFAAWLAEERPEHLERIAALANGFEGWMKLEFFFWLTTYRSPRLMHEVASREGPDVGVEYKISLDPRFPDTPPTKQCDIWIRSSTNFNLFHYVELKAPFLNKNATKLLNSAAHDFVCMSRIRHSYEQAASGNAIILGVGFDDNNWKNGLERLRAYPGVPEDAALVDSGPIDRAGMIRWCGLTRSYL